MADPLPPAKKEPSASSRTIARLLYDQKIALEHEGFTKQESLSIVTDLLRTFITNASKDD